MSGSQVSVILKMKVAQSCLTLCNPLDYLWNSPGQDTGVGSLSLLQGIFPTQGSNWSLPHCRLILYQLSHKGSPSILEWVAYPFSSGSFWPRNRTRVSCIAGGFFTNWDIREANSEGHAITSAEATIAFLRQWPLAAAVKIFLPPVITRNSLLFLKPFRSQVSFRLL